MSQTPDVHRLVNFVGSQALMGEHEPSCTPKTLQAGAKQSWHEELIASSEEESGHGGISSEDSCELDFPLKAAGRTGLDWARC